MSIVTIHCKSCKTGLRFDDNLLKSNAVNIKCPKCSTQNSYHKPVAETPVSYDKTVLVNSESENAVNLDLNQPVACLIVHTEERASKTFELRVGESIVGRKSNQSEAQILIEDDLFISRQHCKLKLQCNKVGIVSCTITDLNSTNGTFLNTKQLGISDEWFLTENDTVQIGRTKFVFKLMNQKPVADLEREVAASKFERTVII